MFVSQSLPAASSYAVVISVCACEEVASAECVVPLTIPAVIPVIDVPGDTPKSPATTLKPVFVTAEPPRTAKLSAVKRSILAGVAANIFDIFAKTKRVKMNTNVAKNLDLLVVIPYMLQLIVVVVNVCCSKLRRLKIIDFVSKAVIYLN